MLLKWAHFVVGGVLIVQITVLKSCGESNLIVHVSLDIKSKLKLANPYFATIKTTFFFDQLDGLIACHKHFSHLNLSTEYRF